jgi:hypothetical protein
VTRAAKDLLAEAITLPEDERLQVASELIASVDGPRDPDWEDAWFDEVLARDARHPERLPPTQEWTEVRGRLLAKLGR